MSEIYENDEGDYITDCGWCQKPIEIEAEDYYMFGIVYHNKTCFDNNEINECYHEDCFKMFSEGLAEETKKLIDGLKKRAKH